MVCHQLVSADVGERGVTRCAHPSEHKGAGVCACGCVRFCVVVGLCGGAVAVASALSVSGGMGTLTGLRVT